jgi:hypothetical protein
MIVPHSDCFCEKCLIKYDKQGLLSKYQVGDTVKINDGFALIGEKAEIVKVSEGNPISYKLSIANCWWLHSQIELTESDNA